jgi:hypothetical protein
LVALLAIAFAYPERASVEASPAIKLPFSVGERLVYSVKWDPPWYLFFIPPIEAGEAEVQLVGETEYHGKKAFKILFKAHSSGMMVRVSGMRIEDEYVFFTEPGTFCTLGFSKKIRQGRRKRQIDVDYLRETHQLHFREVDEAVVPSKLKKDITLNGIPSCVQDPLSALYSYRTAQTPEGHTQNFLIGHDDRIKEVKSLVEKKEVVETPAGKFTAWRINTIALMGELFQQGGQFKVWLSADEKKLPVQFEIKVNLGRVFGKLKSRPS